MSPTHQRRPSLARHPSQLCSHSVNFIFTEPTDPERCRGTSVLILPAIDLRGGQCVRLQQGDYGRETVFDNDPAAVAQRWVSQGATYLHVVDLDGAKIGHSVNGGSIRRIVEAAGVPCQLGGGLRTETDLVGEFGFCRGPGGGGAPSAPD